MTEVRTLFADPRTVCIDGEYGTWLVSGVATNRLRDLVTTARGVHEISDELATQCEDAVVVFVSGTEDGGRVTAFRSVTSSRDVYYLEASDGALVLTDHFRNAVSQLDVADRSLRRSALADHLLFRCPIEPTTYVEEIGRLGRGECLDWNGVDREWTRTVVDTLDGDDRHAPADAADELDESLAGVLRLGARPDARTMLSGGVDSTLLASYRDAPPSPVQMAVDTPEFRAEAEAGREAADVLDVSRDVVEVQESSFRDHLETAVDALGLPPRYNQTVFTAAAFQRLPAGQYVNGQGADALFGLPGVKAARIADWLGPITSASVPDRVSSLAPDRVRRSCSVLAARGRQLREPVSSPESFAQSIAADLGADAVASVFDASAVEARTQRRLDYATNRASLEAPDGFPRQVETGHLLDLLGDDAVNQWRQIGFVGGQSVVAPFHTRSVARTALGVPAERRYVQGLRHASSLTAKHIPKTLLSRRLPDYPVYREKSAGSLPIERYVTDGPLDSVFDRYAPPAFLSPENRERHVDSFGSLTWELLTLSVWRDRILLNGDLDVVPGTEPRYLRLPREPSSPTARTV